MALCAGDSLMAFERYMGGRRGRGPNPEMSIYANGMLMLNAVAVQRWFASSSHVSLWYDSETRQIGLKSAPVTEDGVYRLRRQEGRRYLDGKAFLQHFHISHAVTRRFRARVDGEMVLIQLEGGNLGYSHAFSDESNSVQVPYDGVEGEGGRYEVRGKCETVPDRRSR